MKKLALTLAIVLTMGLGAYAQHSLLGRSEAEQRGGSRDITTPSIPSGWSNTGDVNADGNEGPVGSGIVLLAGLGGAYLLAKKRKEE